MEEKDIQKSSSEYASALILIWKWNGELRVCTDFRWLNARTVKDAYPLPHQADALAALGGNAFLSTMDLTSGFYMNKKIFQFIVPDSKKQKVLHGPHDAAGHQGQHRTLSLVRQRFFWSGMERDVKNYV